MGNPKGSIGQRAKKNQIAELPRKFAAPTPKSEPTKKRTVASLEEESFPRGGASNLTHLERREVERQAKEEFDAEVLAGKVPKLSSSNKKAKVNMGSGMQGCMTAWNSLPCAWLVALVPQIHVF